MNDTVCSTARVAEILVNSLYLRVISPFFLKNVFLLILGLRVFGVRTRTPFTGGAEALLRHTGRDGGDAGLDGKHGGETLGRAGETVGRIGKTVAFMRV